MDISSPKSGFQYTDIFFEKVTRNKSRRENKSINQSYPTFRYSLCEMSVTWNMFGGHDFRPANEVAPPKKTVTIDDPRKQGSPTTVK